MDRAFRVQQAAAYKAMLDEQVIENKAWRTAHPPDSREVTGVEEVPSPVRTSPFRTAIAHGGEIIRNVHDQAIPNNFQLTENTESKPPKQPLYRKTYAHGGDIVHDKSYYYKEEDFDKKYKGGQWMSPEEKQSEWNKQRRQIELRRQLDEQRQEQEYYKKKVMIEEIEKIGHFSKGTYSKLDDGEEDLMTLREAQAEVEVVGNLSRRFDEAVSGAVNENEKRKDTEYQHPQLDEKLLEMERANQEKLRENKATVDGLRTVIDGQEAEREVHIAELESLRTQLAGIKAGQQFFLESLQAGGDPFADIKRDPFSPIKKRRDRARTVTRMEEPGESTQLKARSDFVPLNTMEGSSDMMRAKFGLELNEDQHAVVSSGLLGSTFGLSSFEKGLNSHCDYEARKEEFLESFLRAFQENA